MVLCMCLGMLYYGPRAGAGRAWLPRPRLVTVDTTNTSSGQQPQPGRRETESLRGIFHPETEPSSVIPHGSTMGVLYGKKTFYTVTLSLQCYVI